MEVFSTEEILPNCNEGEGPRVYEALSLVTCQAAMELFLNKEILPNYNHRGGR